MTIVADDHSAAAAVSKPDSAVLFWVGHCTVTVWVVGADSMTVTVKGSGGYLLAPSSSTSVSEQGSGARLKQAWLILIIAPLTTLAFGGGSGASRNKKALP